MPLLSELHISVFYFFLTYVKHSYPWSNSPCPDQSHHLQNGVSAASLPRFMLHRATRKHQLLASLVVGWLASLVEISIILKELRPLLMLVLPASLNSFLVSGLSPATCILHRPQNAACPPGLCPLLSPCVPCSWWMILMDTFLAFWIKCYSLDLKLLPC